MSFFDFAILNEGWIAFLYYSLAFLTASTFYLRDVSTRTNWIARIGGVSFFMGCAFTHVEMVAHAYPPTPMEYQALHHAIPVLMQSVGAAVFIFTVLANGTRGFFSPLAANPDLRRSPYVRCRTAQVASPRP